jgi:hypothetical protein
MDHVHGRLIDPQGRTSFEGLDVYLDTRPAAGGGEAWSGYFDPPTASGLLSGTALRLVLEDGRAGEIIIQGIQPGTRNRPRVLFSGESRRSRPVPSSR